MLISGLDTLQRGPLYPPLPTLTPLTLPDPVRGNLRIQGAHLKTASATCSILDDCAFESCLIDAKVTPRRTLRLADTHVAAMLNGAAFDINRSLIGSVRRPDGSYRRATEDGIRPCTSPGTRPADLPSSIIECDIINNDGRNGAVHMDGVQLWWGGRLTILRTKIIGWWQAGVMLKSDHGPIEDVTIASSFLAGANYFQIRAIDGGHGRPRGLTITDTAVAWGAKGGRHPINTGDDVCSLESQAVYVRTEAERREPDWVVYSRVTDESGEMLPPVSGWLDPATGVTSMVF